MSYTGHLLPHTFVRYCLFLYPFWTLPVFRREKKAKLGFDYTDTSKKDDVTFLFMGCIDEGISKLSKAFIGKM